MVAHATATQNKPIYHFLRNRFGWVLVCCVLPTGLVRIERNFKGEPAGDNLLMTADEARAHYASQRRSGMVATMNSI